MATRYCFILRGLPGAGKTLLATKLVAQYDALVFSANHYFMLDGVFRYERKLVPKAHSDCWGKFLFAVAKSTNSVVVDNSASQLWEYEKYVRFAELHEMTIHTIEIRCDDEATLALFHGRNIHDVPLYAVQRMKARWERDPRAELIHSEEILHFEVAV